MKKWMLVVIFPLLVMACKGKKKQISDDEGITATDFVEFFEEVKPPFTIADSSFDRKKTDTASISYKTFTSLVPDTVLIKQFGKTTKPKLYPLGKISVEKKETYLLVKAISPARKVAYMLVFNKDTKFVAAMPLLAEDNNAETRQTAVIDNRYSITTNVEHKAADGHMLYRKAAYAYIGSAGAFALILTESNETETKRNILNPIDTLPRKSKLAGDYMQNNLNLVSVRDSKKPGQILFFIHFEKDANCRGELKGEAKMLSPTKALYQQAGDQCELQLAFAGNSVTITEENCGSHRDIKCFFEGSFIRKPSKAAVKKPVKTPPKAGSKLVTPSKNQ